jgi:hypothetical protein
MLHRRRTSVPNKSNDDRAENTGKTRERERERVGKTERDRDRERMARKQARRRRRRRSECGTCLLIQCV